MVAVLPAAAIISFLFRLREVKLSGSGVQHAKGRKTEKDLFEGEVCKTQTNYSYFLGMDNENDAHLDQIIDSVFIGTELICFIHHSKFFF